MVMVCTNSIKYVIKVVHVLWDFTKKSSSTVEMTFNWIKPLSCCNQWSWHAALFLGPCTSFHRFSVISDIEPPEGDTLCYVSSCTSQCQCGYAFSNKNWATSWRHSWSILRYTKCNTNRLEFVQDNLSVGWCTIKLLSFFSPTYHTYLCISQTGDSRVTTNLKQVWIALRRRSLELQRGAPTTALVELTQGGQLNNALF